MSVTAIDSDGSSSQAATFTVSTDNNQAPNLNAIGNQLVNEGESISIDLIATDPDGDDLSFITSAYDLRTS